ncbi:hypothetical protein EG831_03805 [bacterium]|nr:hypothetical protein [bacterium]
MTLHHTIAGVTPTVCELMGVAPPALSTAGAFAPVIERIAAQWGTVRFDRCLVYAPDALGTMFLEGHPDILAAVCLLAPLRVDVRSMLPPKTPVCFASMFTGAEPPAHGIRAYQKLRLACDTLFDAMLRAGKRPAIAAVRDSSCDLIFRGRDMDYFSEEYDPQVTDRAIGLLRSDRHDLVLAYHQEYDDSLHASGTASGPSLAAARRHVADFARLCAACDEAWRGHDRLAVFAPDHGGHDDPATGRGGHGDDIPEDMLVTHCFRAGRAGQ